MPRTTTTPAVLDETPEPIELESLEPLPVDAPQQEDIPDAVPSKMTPLSPEMLQLAQIMQENTMRAVGEMRKPSEEDQRKIDDERARRANNARQIALQTAAVEAEMKARQQSCSHSKGNGMTSFVAQVNSNNCYRAFCPLCQYISPQIKAEPWQQKEGLNFNKMRGITIATLEAWAARSGPPDPIPMIPVGMVPDLSGI